MLELRNVRKVYKPKKGVKTTALNDINLSFNTKGLVFLVGKSGSGKSTLLNLIGLLDKPTSGSVVLNNKDLTKLSKSKLDKYRNTCIGFVFQDYNLILNYSVSKNMELALSLQRKKVNKKFINEILKGLDLENLGNRNINELSGGQKQRVAIARAIIKNPNIILADEPTGNLDSENSISIFNILKNISKERLVIVATHDLEYATTYADRIIELKDGCVIEDRVFRDTLDDMSEIKVKSSRLSLFKSFSYAFKNLKKRSLRVLITSFIVTVSLSIFAFTSLFTKFDVPLMHADAMVRENENRVEISKGVDGKQLSDKHPAKSFTSEEIISVTNNLKSKYYLSSKLVLNNSYFSFDYDTYKYNQYAYYQLSTDDIYFLEYNISDIEKLKIIGNVPKEKGEILINKVTADYIISNGLSITTLKDGMLDSYYYKPNSYEEIVNDKVKIFLSIDRYLVISGIVDEDMSKYDSLKKILYDDILVNPSKLYDEFKSKYSKKLNEVIVPVNFYDNLDLPLNSSFDLSLFKNKLIYGEDSFYISDFGAYDENLFSLYSSMGVKKFYMFNENGLINDVNLKDDEIILSASDLYKIFPEDNTEEKNKEYMEFLKSHISYMSLEDAQIEYYTNYVKNRDIIGKYVTITVNDLYNRFGSEKTHTFNFKVVGVDFTDLGSYVSYNVLKPYMRDNREVMKIFVIESDKDKLTDIFRTYSDGSNYVSSTVFSSSINIIKKTVGKLEKISLYVSGGFLVFSVILLTNFIVTSITKNKKDIGILKALGAKNLDVYKIFYLESFLISILSVAFSSLICYFGVSIVNKIISKSLFYKIEPIMFNPNVIIYVIVLAVVITFVSSVIPIIKITRSKVVDIIYDK